MSELLAPAGNIEAFIAAISNGCDAIYLGMKKFGARAYSSNFDFDELKEAIAYAHIRNVKVYVTMNTIVFEDEMEEMKAQIHTLNEIGVDGIIVQDMAVFDYIVNNFTDLEAHCSTQMGIDDLEGTLLWKELGAKRVVLSREVPIEKAIEIRKTADIPIEIFVHGALCVSYSGNCLISGLTGYRSGNRGRCVGSCRKPYELIDTTTNTSLGKNYLLSMKDLNTIEHIEDLKQLDSLKIEGRMKESVYVANVVSNYRNALDYGVNSIHKDNLLETFNRTYTKGYMFHEDPKNITNITRPNNYGYEIGKISGMYKGMCEITLSKELRQNDIVRIDHNNEDIILSLARMYDRNGNLINSATHTCYVKMKEKVSVGDIVYKTKDYLYNKKLETMLDQEFRRFPLDIKVYAYPDSHLVIEAEGLDISYMYESEEILSEAINNPTSKETIVKQFSKLNDSVFTLHHVEFEEYHAFIPVKLLNQARRAIVQGLYEAKVNSKLRRNKEAMVEEKISFPRKEAILTASVTTKEQYDACIECGLEEVYFENVVRRNQNTYTEKEGTLLLGGYGGIYHYRHTNPFITDYSLNVVNAKSCYKLHQLGAKRITLSYEINKKQIKDLLDAYKKENDGYPALEMIVYGYTPLLFTKYCPLKKMNQCGICKNKSYVLKDEHGIFPILSHQDCATTILNGKKLNLLDEMPYIEGIEAFRLNFTLESKEEVKAIIQNAMAKLQRDLDESLFDSNTNTRGNYNREII